MTTYVEENQTTWLVGWFYDMLTLDGLFYVKDIIVKLSFLIIYDTKMYLHNHFKQVSISYLVTLSMFKSQCINEYT